MLARGWRFLLLLLISHGRTLRAQNAQPDMNTRALEREVPWAGRQFVQERLALLGVAARATLPSRPTAPATTRRWAERQ